MSELVELTAAQAIEAIRRGEVTAEAVWSAYRERAAADDFNAYTWVAGAEPPEEPPGTRLRSHGLSVGPKAPCSVEEPIANSSWLVLPRIGAPAPVSRSTAVAVYGGR